MNPRLCVYVIVAFFVGRFTMALQRFPGYGGITS